MGGSILNSFDCGGFDRLIVLCQFVYALAVGVFNNG
jgi:hypothetical protein